MMQSFRKKAIEIQAVRLTHNNAPEVAQMCGGRIVVELVDEMTMDNIIVVGVNIPTLEGVMRANEGDYVIRGVQGEYYPCKADIFEQTYEDV